MSHQDIDSQTVALIGMAGRFPGAADLERFWNNLAQGVESISFFKPTELDPLVREAAAKTPGFVGAFGLLEDIELFDASFFGYSARDAEITDPQQRLFLECAWEALESAGQDPDRVGSTAGVFGGVASPGYLFNLLANGRELSLTGDLSTLLIHGTDKDHLSTRVSYKLNLRGPSVTVQTACSTSLVAVHMACQNLLSYQCDLALAGGASLSLPQRGGYVYREGGILSPDGHCRPFDSRAQGTVFGSSVGVVVLKRLEDALADGDRILALIRGSSINNDGALKIGYTAPSHQGQVEVIRAALTFAGVGSETIDYVEAHGTGTSLGDPIEVAALTEAFDPRPAGTSKCSLGSLKSNVGHLNTAAGVAGLIKTVLALEHGQIPPSLNYEKPNPKIDFETSPFRVNTELREWKREGHARRAGVSSFGIGGTNAHVVVEEAPERETSPEGSGLELLVMSARNETALREGQERLKKRVEGAGEEALWDMAWTLQTGRKGFELRRARVVGSRAEAAQALGEEKGWQEGSSEGMKPRVIFLFSGQGSQRVGMGRELYEKEEVFRKWVDTGSETLKAIRGEDLRGVMYPSEETEEARVKLNRTEWAQVALYVVEYALCQLWKSWGVEPEGMVGHSIGEYVAATEAGVVSFEEGVRVVSERGRLMGGLEGGKMMAVMAGRQEVEEWVKGQGVEVAAYNGPKQSVVSGRGEAIERFAQVLKGRGVGCKELTTSHAFHSGMMEPMMGEFLEVMKRVKLKEPQKRYVSNVSGKWVKAEEATDAGYWVKHLRSAVDFVGAVEELEKEEGSVYVEVGPGRTLAQLVKQAKVEARSVTSLWKEERREVLGGLGQLWCWGVEVDWKGVHGGRRRLKVELPTYAFQRQRYWLERKGMSTATSEPRFLRHPDLSQWSYVPSWKRSAPRTPDPTTPDPVSILVFGNPGDALSEALQARLQPQEHLVWVRDAAGFADRGERGYEINPASPEDYSALVSRLLGRRGGDWRVLNLSGLQPGGNMRGQVERAREAGFCRWMHLIKAWASSDARLRLRGLDVTMGSLEVVGQDIEFPAWSLAGAACQVLSQENPQITLRSLDLEPKQRGRSGRGSRRDGGVSGCYPSPMMNAISRTLRATVRGSCSCGSSSRTLKRSLAAVFLSGLLSALAWLSCLGVGLNVAASSVKSQAGQDIRIGFWKLRNLRDFGHERSDFRAIAGVLHSMDCVAVTEVYDDRALSKLANELTILGGRWNKVKNKRRVGFTHATSERYAILYRSDRLEVVDDAYTLSRADSTVSSRLGRQRIEHRPFLCKFATLDQRFDFTLMVMNATRRSLPNKDKSGSLPTKPHAYTDAEIEGLRDVLGGVLGKDPKDRDFILLGNFQRDVGTPSLAEILSLPGMVDLARPDQPTTLEGDHTFAHIFFQSQNLTEFHGKSGVDRFEQTWFDGNVAEALRTCSDQRPIWMTLTIPARDDD